MAQAFMRAYNKSLAYVAVAPADEIAAKELEYGFFSDIDSDVLVSTINSYKQLGCWQIDPVISKSAYNKLIDIFMFNGLISQRHDYNEIIVSI